MTILLPLVVVGSVAFRRGGGSMPATLGQRADGCGLGFRNNAVGFRRGRGNRLLRRRLKPPIVDRRRAEAVSLGHARSLQEKSKVVGCDLGFYSTMDTVAQAIPKSVAGAGSELFCFVLVCIAETSEKHAQNSDRSAGDPSVVHFVFPIPIRLRLRRDEQPRKHQCGQTCRHQTSQGSDMAGQLFGPGSRQRRCGAQDPAPLDNRLGMRLSV